MDWQCFSISATIYKWEYPRYMSCFVTSSATTYYMHDSFNMKLVKMSHQYGQQSMVLTSPLKLYQNPSNSNLVIFLTNLIKFKQIIDTLTCKYNSNKVLFFSSPMHWIAGKRIKNRISDKEKHTISAPFDCARWAHFVIQIAPYGICMRLWRNGAL